MNKKLIIAAFASSALLVSEANAISLNKMPTEQLNIDFAQVESTNQSTEKVDAAAEVEGWWADFKKKLSRAQTES